MQHLQTLSDGAGIAGADDASLSGGLTTNTSLGTATNPINVALMQVST